ncbi:MULTISPECIES: heme exporter protein CcmD [Halomonadaceae]|mgnify:FL=1|uniref:heme exporter protein CcmD n=1 Tax=Halomonadaceae TaxID=28256 RepID=UPI0004E39903|nr:MULTISPECIES: heme exporter protein CcmD [Halomonas]KFC51539.1 heme exporter protein CcmD [Halomonas sp. SUBG004]MCG7575665.1 heme exporter protein CcmD [Halomonas sp. MMH1-48]MCG7589221.1 heme exporter protein CcmD [Halomonas sp. McD50-5]MCG7602727.1 heme exporter protein CcmD [Halomonas sp. MM17-34]MCG7612234.1 heme exporter protein CcmD [Halomonas sp. MM17-29]
MAFSSLNEFFAMGGHAVYVWAAWGVTALLMLVIVWHARQERRQLLHAVKRRVRRENAQRQSSYAQSLQEPVTSAQKDVHHDA